jgi:hypothetical protein
MSLCFSAYADDDLFQVESGHWMSFDHYKDADKRGILPSTQEKSETSTDSQQAPVISSPTAPVAIAAPSRPIDLPVMPGMNKGFNIQISTTEDDRVAPPPILNTDTQADIHLSDKNWQSPSSTLQKSTAEGDDDQAPLAVRLSYLPDKTITPIPSPDHDTAQHKARLALEQGMKIQNKAAEEKVQPAVCAAIDAYKKQQLNAIQSDRETLKSLQEAIASLGLQKELGFMTGNDSVLSGSQGSAQINTPLSTTVR